MKQILISFIALFFSLDCMAFSEEQAKKLVNDFYNKLNVIANEIYCQRGVTTISLEATNAIQNLVWSRYISIPNDFLYYGANDEEKRLPVSIYLLRLKDKVLVLHELKLPFKFPYQLDILSVDSVVNNDSKEVYYIVKLNKTVTFGENTVSFDERITIHASSNKIVEIENTAIDPMHPLIDVFQWNHF